MTDDTVCVSSDDVPASRFPSSPSTKYFDITVQQGIATSLVFNNETADSSFIGETFRYTDHPSEAAKVLATESMYDSVLKRWHNMKE